MKKEMHYLFASIMWGVVVSALVEAGCSSRIGSGVKATQHRKMERFERVAVSGVMDLHIRIGHSPMLRIEGDEGIITATETRVDNGTLIIRVPKVARPDIRTHVEIVTPHLKQIRAAVTENVRVYFDGAPLEQLSLGLTGIGKLEVNNLITGRLNATVSGTGTMAVTGRAEEFYFALSGMGRGEFGQFCSGAAKVDVNGFGKVTVSAADSLCATVTGLGSVDYYGAPHLTPNLRGGGRIRSIGDTPNICARTATPKSSTEE